MLKIAGPMEIKAINDSIWDGEKRGRALNRLLAAIVGILASGKKA